MSESLAQSIADSYWPEVRKWALAHPGKNAFASGHVFCWIDDEAFKCADDSSWRPHDIRDRAIEILKERIKALSVSAAAAP